jgi:proline iminopeptidase
VSGRPTEPADYRDLSERVEAPGAELYVELVGPASAPVVYYLHGGPGYSSHSFRELVGDDLARWLVVYADMRGGGRSFSDDGRGADPDALAADVPVVLDALGLGSAALLGHGFGALVAVTAALAAPERVTGLVLVNPWLSLPMLAERLLRTATAAATPRDAAHVDAGDGLEVDDAPVEPFGSGAGAADAAFRLLNPKVLFDTLQFPNQAARLHLEHVDAEALSGPQEEDEADTVWEREALSALRELAVSGKRVVVIAGELDGTAYPEQVEAALEGLPGALYSGLGTGHYPWLDDPEAFLATLEAALEYVTGS